MRVGYRSPVELDLGDGSKKIEIEELAEKLRLENFYPNPLIQIVEGTVTECLTFIGVFASLQTCRVIKNFYGQSFEIYFNPYSYSNEVLIENTETFKEVEQTLRLIKGSKYEPKKELA